MAADWLEGVTRHVEDAFRSVHAKFIDTIALVPQSRLDQSGTTATIAFVTANYVILASLGDSRAIISSKIDGKVQATQLTRDHTASDLDEKAAVEARGGTVVTVNGVDRVNGQLVVTRSLGDARLSPFLSQTPDVMPFTRTELLKMCGELEDYTDIPCFLILASDGLWDVVSNNEAVSCLPAFLLHLSIAMRS
jgi:protein phosphatase 1L